MDKEKLSTIIEKLKGIFKRSSALTVLPQEEKEITYSSPHYNMGQEYRVMAYNSRLLGMAFGFSMLGNVGLACALFSLFPLKETQHHLVALRNSSDQVVQIQPLEKGEKGRDELLKLTCRDYVIARETINLVDEDSRWAEQVRFLSSDQVWTDFWSQMDTKLSSSAFKDYLDRKATRTVIILNTSQLTDEIFLIDWESIITEKGRERKREKFRSTLKVKMVTNKLKAEHKHLNPIGFSVERYEVSRMEDSPR